MIQFRVITKTMYDRKSGVKITTQQFINLKVSPKNEGKVYSSFQFVFFLIVT